MAWGGDDDTSGDGESSRARSTRRPSDAKRSGERRGDGANALDPSRLTKSLVDALAPRHEPDIRRRGKGPKPGRPEIEINTEDLALYVANGGQPMFWAREHGVRHPVVYRRLNMMKRVVGRWLEATVGPNAAKDVGEWRLPKVARVWLSIGPELREALADSRYDAFHEVMEAMKR